MSVVSMIAIAPSAFADHHDVTVDMAIGSGFPDSGCENTDECYLSSTVAVLGMKQSGSQPGVSDPTAFVIVIS